MTVSSSRKRESSASSSDEAGGRATPELSWLPRPLLLDELMSAKELKSQKIFTLFCMHPLISLSFLLIGRFPFSFSLPSKNFFLYRNLGNMRILVLTLLFGCWLAGEFSLFCCLFFHELSHNPFALHQWWQIVNRQKTGSLEFEHDSLWITNKPWKILARLWIFQRA